MDNGKTTTFQLKDFQSSDKSLNNLMNTLLQLQKTAKEKTAKIENEASVSASDPHQTERGKLKSEKTPTRLSKLGKTIEPNRKRCRILENSPKITWSWLNKENSKTNGTKRMKEDKEAPNKSKLKPLDVTVVKSSKRKTKFERNSSFEKYGIVIPSYEKIVEDQKKFDEHKNQVKAFDSLDDKILEKAFKNDCLKEAEEFTGEILDCKHLSVDELNQYINKYSVKLRNIKDGKLYSERHQKFYNFNRVNFLTTKDLRYSTSLVVFTQEQKDRMLDAMRAELDPDDKLMNYFFQVLLPELCLLIFMDVHKMDKQKANQYLDIRPLDI